MTQRTREQNREYMRSYMKRYRRLGKAVRDVGERRPIVPPAPLFADLAAAVFGDPPIGRRAIDAAPGRQPYQLEAAP